MKNPNSFIVFLIAGSTSLVAILLSFVFSYFRVDMKYAIFLAILLFVAASASTVGIYSGFRYQAENKRMKKLNLIGMIGNMVIFLFVLGLMIGAVFSHPG